MPSPDPKQTDPRNKGRAAAFALAVASGHSFREAATMTGTPWGTARRWARSEKFRAAVNGYRERAVSAALGKLSAAAVEAVDTLRDLCANGEAEATQLGAARAILDRLPALSEHYELTRRLDELEAVARSRGNNGGRYSHGRN